MNISNFNLENLNLEDLNKRKYQGELKIVEIEKTLEAKKQEILASKENMPGYLKDITDKLLSEDTNQEERNSILSQLLARKNDIEVQVKDCIDNINKHTGNFNNTAI